MTCHDDTSPEGLWQHGLISFREAVAHEPMPGCGATAVVSADLGLALVLKGLHLSQRHEHDAVRATLIEAGEELKRRLAPLADEDVAAFEAFMAALTMSHEAPKEQSARKSAIQRAASEAVDVPLRTARLCQAALTLCERAKPYIEQQFTSDTVAGARLLHAALHAVLLNVEANLGALGSDAERDQARLAHDTLQHDADASLARIVRSA